MNSIIFTEGTDYETGYYIFCKYTQNTYFTPITSTHSHARTHTHTHAHTQTHARTHAHTHVVIVVTCEWKAEAQPKAGRQGTVVEHVTCEWKAGKVVLDIHKIIYFLKNVKSFSSRLKPSHLFQYRDQNQDRGCKSRTNLSLRRLKTRPGLEKLHHCCLVFNHNMKHV